VTNAPCAYLETSNFSIVAFVFAGYQMLLKEAMR